MLPLIEDIEPSLARAGEALAADGLIGLFGERLAGEISAHGRRRRLRPADVLFRRGDPGDSMFVLLEGTLDILADIGSRQVCLAVLHPHQLVGEIAVFTNRPRIATVVSREGAKVLRLEREDVLRLVCANPSVSWSIIADIGRRLAAVNRPLAFLSSAVGLLHDEEVDVDALAGMADEVEDLGPFAETFSTMVREIQAKQDRHQDMAMARRIQEQVLPKALRREAGNVSVHAVIRPMKEVGGDLYDYFMIDDRHLAVAVADVSGKGVPASLVMMMLRTVMRAVAVPGRAPGQVIARANALLAEDNEACMFVTALFGILDVESGRFDFVNAGHNPVYLIGPDGRRRDLEASGPALGIFEGARFEERSERMAEGDLLFLYTDGVTEAFSPEGEQYGEERLGRLLGAVRGERVATVIDRVLADVAHFAGGREQSDDITCLALVFRPPC